MRFTSVIFHITPWVIIGSLILIENRENREETHNSFFDEISAVENCGNRSFSLIFSTFSKNFQSFRLKTVWKIDTMPSYYVYFTLASAHYCDAS